ncbi:MAG: TRAM domain-containing protein, partial [Gemmatimonadetes bacterium]|nr:TRAM domain-containing protein [Gemmatimonadota bacterium]
KAARDAGHILGRTRRNKVVAFPGEIEAIGRYGTVTLTSTTGATFRGERVDTARPLAVGSGAAV